MAKAYWRKPAFSWRKSKLIYDLDPQHKTYQKRTEDAASLSMAIVDNGTDVRGISWNRASTPPLADR